MRQKNNRKISPVTVFFPLVSYICAMVVWASALKCLGSGIAKLAGNVHTELQHLII